MKFEIIHDTIAKQVFEKASTEARTRRKVEKFIRERYEAHQTRGAKLTRDDLDYIQPYLNQVNISKEESDFIEKARKALIDARNRIRAIVAGVIIFLLGSTTFSFVQWRNAIEQKEYADGQTIKAKEAQVADSLKAIELGIALEEAEAAKDTAEVARIKAEQEKLRADRETRKAVNQKTLAETNARQTESLAISTIAKNQDIGKLETSLRVLEAAFLKTYPNPPPAEVQQTLGEKFYAQNHSKDQVGHRFASYFPHKSEVKDYQLSPDQASLLSFADDSTLYLWSIKGSLIAELDKHENDITSATFSPDGKQILSSSFDGSAKLWDLKGKEMAHMMMINDGEQLRNRRHRAWFSPDGKHIFTQVSDTLKLWDKTGNKICDIEGSIGPSSDKHFLSYSKGITLLYDYQGNKRPLMEYEGLSYLNFTPDQQNILGISGKLKTTLWNLEGDTLFHTSPLDSVELGSADDMFMNLRPSVKMYPKAKRIILFGGADIFGDRKSAYLLDFEGRFIKSFTAYEAMIPNSSTSVFSLDVDSLGLHAISYDKTGKLIQKKLISDSFSPKAFQTRLYLSDSTNRFWVNKSGDNRAFYEYQITDNGSWDTSLTYKDQITSQSNFQKSVALYNLTSSKGNKYWAIDPRSKNFSSSESENPITYQLVNHIGERLFSIQGYQLQFSKNNKYVFIKSGKNIKKIELEGSLVKKIKTGYKNVSYTLSPDKSKIIAYQGISNRGSIRSVPKAPLKVYSMEAELLEEYPAAVAIRDLQYSEDFSYFMTNQNRNLRSRRNSNNPGGIKGVLGVFNSKFEKVNSLDYGLNGLRNRRFLPNSNSILLNGYQQTSALIWNFISGQVDTLAHEERIEKPIISNDGKHIITYDITGGLFKLWDQRGKLQFQQKLPTHKIASIEFAPDSKSFMARSYDKIARRYSLNGKLIQKFGPYPDFLRAASFSPNGKYILINYLNRAILRNINGTIVSEIALAKQEIYEAGFSPSGKYIWTRNEKNEIQIWNTSGKLQGQIQGQKPHFSPLENLILTQTNETEEILWEISGKQIATFSGQHKFESFAPDGRSYVSRQSFNARTSKEFYPIRIWDQSGKLLASLPGTELHSVLTYSPDSKFLWTLNFDRNELTRWPLPQTIFEYIHTEAKFPQLTASEKEQYRLN
ncbi:MAG: hypothetical protein AAGD28_09815 [Bacteroidota bacterium]